MLAECGYDARLVVGYVRGQDWGSGAGGHAWVGLIDQKSGHEFYLESTGETAESRARTPPRVEFRKDYFPEMQVTKAGYFLPESQDQLTSITKGWTFYQIN